MPSMERIKKLGLLTEKRHELEKLDYRAQGIIGSLHDATFVMSSIWLLEGRKIESYARELRDVLEKGHILQKQIIELEEELNV